MGSPDCTYNFLFYFDHVYMMGGVTRLGGLPSLPGRVTLSTGVTICHVNVQGGVTRLDGVAFMAKSSKAKHVFLNLCTFPSRLLAEITTNRNGHTRSVKCSHFRIFSVVNRPYLVSQTIPYNVLSQRFLAKPNTA